MLPSGPAVIPAGWQVLPGGDGGGAAVQGFVSGKNSADAVAAVTNNVNVTAAVAGSERMNDRFKGTSLFPPRTRVLPWSIDPNRLRTAKSTGVHTRLTQVSLHSHFALIPSP
jgi:hypothetical protein